MKRPRPTHGVVNVHHGYVEHEGTEVECQQWIRNVVSQGFAPSSDFRVVPSTDYC